MSEEYTYTIQFFLKGSGYTRSLSIAHLEMNDKSQMQQKTLIVRVVYIISRDEFFAYVLHCF